MVDVVHGFLAERWLEPITESNDLRKVVRRGKILARKGRVNNLGVRSGLVTAEVASDSGITYSLKIRMPLIADRTWEHMFDLLAGEASYTSELLRGRLTEDCASVFDVEGVELFPFDLRDITNFCSCNENPPVCTHAVATHLALAEAMTADPFLLFEFRGRPREQFLGELRKRRGNGREPVTPGEAADGEGGPDTEDASELLDGYWDKGVLPHLAFRFDANGEHEEDEALPVVRALGPGPGDIAPEAVVGVLAPLVRMARKRLSEVLEQAASDEDEPEVDPDSGSLDDILVAAAHQHGELTTGFVAEALGISNLEARKYLQWLVEEGRLQVRGKARWTRYVPAEAAEAAETAG